MDNHATKAGFGIREAAIYAGVSRSLLYKLIASGKLTAVKIGRRTILSRRELDHLIGQASDRAA
jgi:excisionase family DNA binding protein